MAHVAEELPLLPRGAQHEERILELAEQLLRVEEERQRLLRLIEVDVAAHDVVTGREEQVRILFLVDQRHRAVQERHRRLGLTRVEAGDRLLYQGASERVRLAELAIDLLRL